MALVNASGLAVWAVVVVLPACGIRASPGPVDSGSIDGSADGTANGSDDAGHPDGDTEPDGAVDAGGDAADADADAGDGDGDGGDPPGGSLTDTPGGFPRGYFFRLEYIARRQSERLWLDGMGRLDGVIMKAVDDEIWRLLALEAPDRLRSHAVVHPDQTQLLHVSQVGLDPRWSRAQTFPSTAWLYHPGCRLSARIEATTTELCLPVTCADRVRHAGVGLPGQDFADDLVIVGRLGLEDNWDRVEHVTVRHSATYEGVCPSDPSAGNVLVVPIERGKLGTAASIFNAGCYVAPHVTGGAWGNRFESATDPDGARLVWHVNYGSPSGVVAMANLMEELLTDSFPGIDGLALDFGTWSISHRSGRPADVDRDGVGDNGVVGGDDRYALGAKAFYSDVRARLPHRVLIADGGLSTTQRAVSALSGVELEGLAGPTDGHFRTWSSGINRLDYWRTHNPAESIRRNYVVHKDPDDPTAHEARMVMAAAAILEAGVAPILLPTDVRPEGCPAWDWPNEVVPIWDELVGGADNVPRWLGLPVGPPVFHADLGTDLLDGAGLRPTAGFVSRRITQAAGVSVVAVGGELVATRTAGSGDLEFTLDGLSIPAGTDFVLTVDGNATPLPAFDAHTPRNVTVTADGALLPEIGGSVRQDRQLSGWIGDDDTSLRFFYRHTAAATVSLRLRFEGSEPVRLRNLRVSLGTDAMARRFERGLVLVNPSVNHRVAFDVGALAPTLRLRRLRGTPCQDPNHNNGEPVTGLVELDPSDGLFLVHDDR